MSAHPSLVDQLAAIVAVLNQAGITSAIIGGVAVNYYGHARGTRDIDLLIATTDADAAHDSLIADGFELIYRTDETASYQRDQQRVDFVYAHRPLALEFLHEATAAERGLRFVALEALIALKLQAFNNDARRIIDLDDMIQLLRIHGDRVDRAQLQDIFALFDRQDLLDDIFAQIAN